MSRSFLCLASPKISDKGKVRNSEIAYDRYGADMVNHKYAIY